MNCVEFQNELFHLSDAKALPEGLLRHAASCPTCQALADRTVLVESALSKLPVPASSKEVQAAFLNQITAAAPIVTRREPARPTREPVNYFKVVGSLAASVLVLAGVWWAFREPPSSKPVAHQRHELLAKQVNHTVALAQATTAPKRLGIWAEIASDLRSEVQMVYRVAANEDMANLSNLYDSAIQNGIVGQAEALPPTLSAVERNQVLKDAISRLEKAETDTDSLTREAPPQSLNALKRMTDTAKKGRQRLQTLLQQGAS